MWQYRDRRDTLVHLAFLVAFAALLAYSILAWQRLLGLGPLAHPGQVIYLDVALCSQTVAGLLRPRSRRVFYALCAFTIVCLAMSLTAR